MVANSDTKMSSRECSAVVIAPSQRQFVMANAINAFLISMIRSLPSGRVTIFHAYAFLAGRVFGYKSGRSWFNRKFECDYDDQIHSSSSQLRKAFFRRANALSNLDRANTSKLVNRTELLHRPNSFKC
jgi:hypothetical protein